MRFSLILTSAVALVCTGCSPLHSAPEAPRNSELTHGNVQLHVQVGATTQAQVLESFGPPNVASIDDTGSEVWTYQRHATVSRSSSTVNYWTILVAGGRQHADGFEQTQRMMTLIIKFDANDTVSEFRSRASEF